MSVSVQAWHGKKQLSITVNPSEGTIKWGDEKIDPRDVVFVQKSVLGLSVETLEGEMGSKKVVTREVLFENLGDNDSLGEALESIAADKKTVPQIDKLHVILNPFSGTGKSQTKWGVLRRYFDFFKLPYEVHRTMYQLHATEIAAQICAQKEPTNFLCIGGDGITHEVINGIPTNQSPKPTCYILPAGSGNGMARTLGIKTDADAMWTIFNGEPSAVDVFTFVQHQPKDRRTGEVIPTKTKTEKKSFLHLNFGIISDIDFESEFLRCCGATRFPITAVWKILTYPHYRAKITLSVVDYTNTIWKPNMAGKDTSKNLVNTATKEVVIDDDFVLISVSNVSSISEGMCLNPFAHINSGLLDVTVALRSEISRFKLIDLFNRAETTEIATAPYVQHFCATSFKIEPKTDSAYKGKFDLDGEWVTYGDASMGVLPGELSLVTPHSD
eukprot:TRINITY_DN31863_c0_g1_i1.p1 TRINITY_DN31863_c0_g1~~TRINITY_DN31863_c0_g1_i1.p1  ORF type:complete len:442 (+),score=55.71 TRINITY_DN31863_c0_g1_i1:67-1392(+)